MDVFANPKPWRVSMSQKDGLLHLLVIGGNDWSRFVVDFCYVSMIRENATQSISQRL